MLNLARNQFPVYYKMYQGQTEIVDEWGNKTGSFTPQYGDIKVAYMSVSPNKGTSEAEMFGSIDDYDRTMVTADVTCPIDTKSILWMDGHSTMEAHNYIVVKRAPWKNSIAYAVKRVDVSG